MQANGRRSCEVVTLVRRINYSQEFVLIKIIYISVLLITTPIQKSPGVFGNSYEFPHLLGKSIGQNIAGCSLMWLMPLRSLSNCDYEL